MTTACARDGWRIERVSVTHPDAARLIAEVQGEYTARYGTPDETPLQPGYFDPPDGSFFVGYLADVPVASGAWRRRHDLEIDGRTALAEVKRMYVAPSARRRALARAMLAHLEHDAAQQGAEAIILETGERQPEAIALYASSGYRPIPGFGHYRDSPMVRCMAKDLVSPTRPHHR